MSPSAPPDCVFCKIVRGDTPAYVVYEDGCCAAFLDGRPLFPGHCLMVPRVHYETLADLPPELIGPLFAGVQRLARAVEQAMGADGTFVAQNNHVSQSVPHMHVHVVPRRKKDGLRGFFWPRGKYGSEDEARKVQAAIRGALAGWE